MIGEVSIGGVYLPALLFLGLVTLAVTSALIRLLSLLGAYRAIVARPLVDLCLFMIILWAASALTTGTGPLP